MVKFITRFLRIAVCWKEGPEVKNNWNLVVEGRLSGGSTCSVHKGKYGDIEVAVKCVDNRDCSNEIKSLQKLKNEPSIVHLYDFRTQIHGAILLTELCKGGDLIDYVLQIRRAGEHLTETEVKKVIHWLLFAVKQCHSHSIAHLDIKLDNIGLGLPEDLTSLKLLDFGNSRPLDDVRYASKEVSGTLNYLAPELVTRRYISGAEALRKIDIWAIGVVAYALLEGTFPFATLKHIADLKFSFREKRTSLLGRKFVSMLLTPAEGRPSTVDECLCHEWFDA